MELYRGYWNKVLGNLKEIGNPEEKISYLYTEKQYFLSWGDTGSGVQNIIDLFNSKIEQIKYESLIMKPKPVIKPKEKLSYNWIGDQRTLRNLIDLLLKKHIDKNSRKDLFDVFGEKPKGSFKRAKWILKNQENTSNATALKYLIEVLTDHNLIEENKKRMDYLKIKYCFEDYEGKEFKKAFKDLRTGLMSAKIKSEIESIIQKAKSNKSKTK